MEDREIQHRREIIEAFDKCFVHGDGRCYGCYCDGPGFGVECRKRLLEDVLALLKEYAAMM